MSVIRYYAGSVIPWTRGIIWGESAFFFFFFFLCGRSWQSIGCSYLLFHFRRPVYRSWIGPCYDMGRAVAHQKHVTMQGKHGQTSGLEHADGRGCWSWLFVTPGFAMTWARCGHVASPNHANSVLQELETMCSVGCHLRAGLLSWWVLQAQHALVERPRRSQFPSCLAFTRLPTKLVKLLMHVCAPKLVDGFKSQGSKIKATLCILSVLIGR